MFPGFVLTDMDLREVGDAFDRRGRVTRALRRDAQIKPVSVLLIVEPDEADQAIVAVARLVKGSIFTSFD